MVSFHSHGIDGLSVEVGAGEDRTGVLRLGITNRWRERTRLDAWQLAGYWEVQAAIWDNPDFNTADVGVTPVFRFERRRFFLEAAVGLHLVTTHISAARTFSTALQLGSHLGAGFYFGPGERYNLGLRVQHISNGGVREPNPGINFVLLRLERDLE
jgi:hypothetical protein